MNLQQRALLAQLQDALAAPIGLVLRNTGPGNNQALVAAFYRARYKDSSLSSLQIRMSPLPEGDIIICHSDKVTA